MNVIDSITYKRIEDLEDINAVVLLQSEIWGHDAVSPLPQLVASIHHGGIIIGAFSEERLIGFCYGFAGFKNGETYLISHMTGIQPKYQNAGIGFQLKVQQREWAMAYGYQKIVWTYDPLEVRNGFFNLNKLGGFSQTYHSSYYGEMPDKLNKGLPADRLLIEWDICSNGVEKAISGEWPTHKERNFESILNTKDEFPLKIEKELDQKQAGYFVPVPANIQKVKQMNLEVALAWRFALRDVLSEALSKGFVISCVQRVLNSTIHYYVLENKTLEELNE
jgi:predicted GNAT superfamily acetyltransferase